MHPVKMNKFIVFLFCLSPLFAQAQWQKRIPPGGSSTELVEIKGTFFTIHGTTLYESTNYGQSWQPSGLNKPAYTLEQLRTDEDTLYVSGAAGLTAGIFRSIDLGKTWQEMPSPYIWLYGHILMGAYQGTLYFRESFTLMELKPGATSWETFHTFGSNEYPNLAFGGDYVFVNNPNYLLRYHRPSQLWEVISNTPSTDIFFSRGQLLVFGGPDVLLSDDFGASWETANTIPHLTQLVDEGSLLYAVNYPYGQILQSENLLDWSPAFANSNLYPKKVAVTGNVMLALSDAGQILRSSDLGAYWTVNNSGLPGSIDSPWFAKNHMASYLQLGASLTSDGGKNWFIPLVNGGITGSYVEDNGKILTVSYQNGSYVILKSDLTMKDWQWVSNVPTPVGGDHFSKAGNKLIYNSAKVLVSSDGGVTWVEEGALIEYGGFGYSHKESLIVAGVNGGLSLSPDFGHTWQNIAPAGSGNYYKVVSTGENLFVWHDYLLYVSKDAGQNWQNLTNLVPSPDIGYWAFTASGDSLFVAKKDSVFFSPNLGQSWVNITGDLNLPYCNVLKIFQGELITMTVDGEVRALPLSSIQRAAVRGVVYRDLNNDGIRDIGEKGIENMIVRNAANDAFAISDTAGVFQLLAKLSGDSAVAVLPWSYATSTPKSQLVVPSGSDVSFGIYFDPGVKDLCIAVTAATAFVPGFETKVLLTVKNLGPTTQDAVVQLRIDHDLAFLGSALAPDSVIGNKVAWTIPNLEPFKSATIELTCYLPPSVAAGTSLTFSATVGALDGDANPGNNSDRLITLVRSSFDPNDKTAHTGEQITTDQYAEGEPLKYTVRFQNTGTYPAQFVRIVDTIEAKFDISTFSLLASSHPVSVSIEGGNRLVFFFDRIQLPDSTADEAGSHGFVTFSLKPKPGLQIGAIFRNTAHIYFDYNLPVRTNTATTTLTMPVRVQEVNEPMVSVWPNPTSGELTVQLPVGRGMMDAVQVFDLWGRVVTAEYLMIEYSSFKVSIAALPPGVYFLKCLKNGKVMGSAKVVKQ